MTCWSHRRKCGVLSKPRGGDRQNGNPVVAGLRVMQEGKARQKVDHKSWREKAKDTSSVAERL